MSYTVLYGLFALTSLLLFNSLVVMSRLARQAKEPPKDSDFEQLLAEKKNLEIEFEGKKHELDDTQKQLKILEEKVQKTEDTLQQKLTELQALKNAQGTPPTQPGAAPAPSA